jgi:prohibitin 2
MVSRLVRENLTRRARRFNLILDDVSITHVAFSPEFTHAVEAKQVAQQIAQRAAFLVDQAIQEKQSIIVRAQGEARSAELIGEAVRTNKGFLQLRRLEAARDIAGTLATSGNRLMLDAKSLLLNGESGRRSGCGHWSTLHSNSTLTLQCLKTTSLPRRSSPGYRHKSRRHYSTGRYRAFLPVKQASQAQGTIAISYAATSLHLHQGTVQCILTLLKQHIVSSTVSQPVIIPLHFPGLVRHKSCPDPEKPKLWIKSVQPLLTFNITPIVK